MAGCRVYDEQALGEDLENFVVLWKILRLFLASSCLCHERTSQSCLAHNLLCPRD